MIYYIFIGLFATIALIRIGYELAELKRNMIRIQSEISKFNVMYFAVNKKLLEVNIEDLIK